MKEVYLVYLLRNIDFGSCIVFSSSCRRCSFTEALLTALKVSVAPLHSEMPQSKRLQTLQLFKGGQVSVVVCTDVAARGLDIPAVDLVLNFDFPRAAEDYLHRVGRTARAGRSGKSISLVSQYDVELLQAAEKYAGVRMDEWETEESKVLEGLSEVTKM